MILGSFEIVVTFLCFVVSVADPRAIRYQMVFKKMIMVKMFLSALATGECPKQEQQCTAH